MRQAKIEAIKTARFWLEKDHVYLDTETTGLDDKAEVIDICVIGPNGEKLLDTLVRPTAPIPPGATKIHGITDDDTVDAPTYPDVLLNLKAMLADKLVIIYNRGYDLRALDQSARVNKVDSFSEPLTTACAMTLYAKFHGDWNERRRSYRWQKQSSAARQLGIEVPADLHRAAADAELCRLIVEAMAATPLPGEEIELKLSEKENQAIIQIANHKLVVNSPGHNPHLFNEFHRVWNDGKSDGWLVSLQNRDGDVTRPVIVLNSEIESAIKFLDKLEYLKRNDPIVTKAFEMSPGHELHALRLAVVGLAKSVELLGKKS